MNTPSSATVAVRPARQSASALLVLLSVLMLVPTLGVSSGCTIPSNQGDIDYPTYGGAWQRTRRDSGRVGSVFDPAGARTATLSPRELPENELQGRNERDSIFSAPGTVPEGVDAPRSVDDPYRQRNGQSSPERGTLPADANQIRYQRSQSPAYID